MRHEPCAVMFDLDDTLYPRQRFLLSGFGAVARYLDRHWGIEPRRAFSTLAGAFRTARGRELQVVVRRFDLPPWLVPQLVDVIREHEPRLRLPRASARVLEQLREEWRIGIVTNGPPEIQGRKVEALGLAPLVDTVVYAHATGRGLGKPDRAPFVEAARRLGVCLTRAVFVGDDPVNDIAGAQRVGMHAIRIVRPGLQAWEAAGTADAVVESMDEVPAAAIGLVDLRRAYVV
jgi:putative hydrolase of the HAD superfamily